LARLDGGRLLVLLALAVAGVWLWDRPWLAPLRLLVVLVHETGHALATLALGGRVERVVIAADESGQCLSAVPPGWLAQVAVYSAGYLGSALSGALQLILAFRFRLHRPVLFAMGAWVTAMGLLYGGNAFTVVFCLFTGAALLALARVLPAGAVRAAVMGFAVFTGLYALFDLRDDLWRSSVRGVSDAALLAAQTHLPALAWAALWSLLSVVILGLAAWLSLRKGEGKISTPLEEIRSLGASGRPRMTSRP
jgi:hypothetical protein